MGRRGQYRRDIIDKHNKGKKKCSTAGRRLSKGGARASKYGKRMTTHCKNVAHGHTGKGDWVDKNQPRAKGKFTKKAKKKGVRFSELSVRGTSSKHKRFEPTKKLSTHKRV